MKVVYGFVVRELEFHTLLSGRADDAIDLRQARSARGNKPEVVIAVAEVARVVIPEDVSRVSRGGPVVMSVGYGECAQNAIVRGRRLRGTVRVGLPVAGRADRIGKRGQRVHARYAKAGIRIWTHVGLSSPLRIEQDVVVVKSAQQKIEWFRMWLRRRRSMHNRHNYERVPNQVIADLALAQN